MKYQILLLLICGLAAQTATLVQAQITHTMMFQTGMTGRHRNEVNISGTYQEQEMGIAVTTDADLTSTRTSNAETGQTETYRYETQASSTVIESGQRTGTINAQIYEAYDYSDSGVLHEVSFDF